MIFAIPYIIVTVVLGLLAYMLYSSSDESVRNYIICGALAIFVLFFGFRGFILTDWIIYYPYFNDLEWYQVLYYFDPHKDGYEPGFALLCMLCKSVYPDYFFMQIIVTLITAFALYKFFKHYTDNIPLGLMLFVVFEGIFIATNLVRNSIAISLFLIALPYLEERKPIQYFLLCLLATSFHLSALIYFPLYFFFHFRLNKWVYLAIFIAANIAFLSHISIVVSLFNMLGLDESMAEKVRVYTEEHTTSKKIFSIGYLERLMTGTLIFLYYNKLKALHAKSGIIINAVLAFLCIFFLFGEFEVIAQRIYSLFAFGYWVIWGYFIRCFHYDNNKKLFAAFILLYSILRLAGYCKSPAFDYENILTGHQSYNERLYFTNKYYRSKD
jgi:hypothetical protein